MNSFRRGLRNRNPLVLVMALALLDELGRPARRLRVRALVESCAGGPPPAPQPLRLRTELE